MQPFDISRLRLTLAPKRELVLPPGNAANSIRGAFGTVFRKLCCEPSCREARTCEARHTCPYARVFEPAPPPGSPALSKLESIPRGFVFRAPHDRKTCYAPGETLEFELLLFGSAAQFLPSFVLSFSQLTHEGFGANRAPTELLSVEEIPSSPPTEILGEHVTVRFLTPTHLVSQGKAVRAPDFDHLFKRVRDRINALATFYGAGQIDADFAGLGAASERILTVRRATQWESQVRISLRTGQRHELSGFTGECEFAGDLAPFREWLILGQQCHVGKHAVWGNGQYLLAPR
jgi:hypothetical protein